MRVSLLSIKPQGKIERKKPFKGSHPEMAKLGRASQTPESGLTRTHSVKRKLLSKESAD